MNIQQIKELLKRYEAGDCDFSENELVENYYNHLISTNEFRLSEEERTMMKDLIEARIMRKINDDHSKPRSRIFQLPVSVRWIAAASVIFAIALPGYFLFFQKTTKQAPIANVLPHIIKAAETNRPMITLANGSKVFLDSAGNGTLATQGNLKMVKLANGKIAYQQGAGQVSGKTEYNTLSNPKGSKVINMILSDGSRVWLNTGSAITYPVAFIGNERKVSISGEAYFEVAHDVSKPFTVNKGTINIHVLGTHFNVNAFEDNGQDVEVTLLEGSVKLNNGKAMGLLKPGQQAKVSEEVKILDNVNLNSIMAWKNGYFEFDHASLETVLKQVARWYDINVVYKGKNQPREFVGEIQRDLSLEEVIKILEKNNVHFRIIGKDLIVLPD